MNAYGIIGYPLGHSFSPAFFNEKFAREKLEAEFLSFEIPGVDVLPDIIKTHPELRGFSVTYPHKESLFPMLASLTPEAASVGAVNCVKVLRDGTLIGHNTDYVGFSESLKRFVPCPLTQALILGTGGAAKAMGAALRDMGIAPIYVSRTPERSAPFGITVGYHQLPTLLPEIFLVINATPLGMAPREGEMPPIPYHLLTPSHFLFDAIYNPRVTRFLQEGEMHGAAISNGLEMLHIQAEYAWRFWNED